MAAEAESSERAQANEHRWVPLAVGRMCEKCGLLQERGQFDDAPRCKSGLRLPDRR